MKKAILIAAAALLFSSCFPEGHTYISFNFCNKTSQTLLLSFYDGETAILDLAKINTESAYCFREFDFEKFKNKDAAFYTLWNSPESEFRVYSADTVLLKIWKPNFDNQSQQKDFFRESDWEVERWGEWGCPIIDFMFTITDSDLAPVNSVSAQ